MADGTPTCPPPTTRKAPLTARQQRVLGAIRDATARTGYPPSLREIGRDVGLSSVSSVRHHLLVLEAKGYLRRGGHSQSRAVALVTPEPAAA